MKVVLYPKGIVSYKMVDDESVDAVMSIRSNESSEMLVDIFIENDIGEPYTITVSKAELTKAMLMF